MNANEYLGLYAEGWTNGDASKILQATVDDYTFDDPNVGVISKSNFKDYLEDMKSAVKDLCNGDLPKPFMELSEVVSDNNNENITAWCWWAIPGTDIKGSGLIKATSQGVLTEVITYYTKLNN